jgi:hypothetical protein
MSKQERYKMNKAQVLADLDNLQKTMDNFKAFIMGQAEEDPVDPMDLDNGKRYKFDNIGGDGGDREVRIFLHAGDGKYCFVNINLRDITGLYGSQHSFSSLKTKKEWRQYFVQNNIRLTQVEE